MRGLGLFCFLSVRAVTEIFCDGASGFLDRWNCNSKSACSWCDMYPRSFLNIHLEDMLCFLVAITASSR